MDIQNRETLSKATFFFLLVLEETAFGKDDSPANVSLRNNLNGHILCLLNTHIFVEIANPLQQSNVFKASQIPQQRISHQEKNKSSWVRTMGNHHYDITKKVIKWVPRNGKDVWNSEHNSKQKNIRKHQCQAPVTFKAFLPLNTLDTWAYRLNKKSPLILVKEKQNLLT